MKASLVAVIFTACVPCCFPIVSPVGTRLDFLKAASSLVISSASSVKANSPFLQVPPSNPSQKAPLSLASSSLLPLTGTIGGNRPTLLKEVVPDSVYTQDQQLGIVNVNVPIRSTILVVGELNENSSESRPSETFLVVVNPLAPTPEAVSQVKGLEERFGPVKHVLLTSAALEHRGNLGPFTQKFRTAKCWVTPGQWSFPVGLGLRELGVESRVINYIPQTSKLVTSSEPAAELLACGLEWRTLGPLKFKSVGKYAECAVYHKRSRTLVTVDSAVAVSSEPPDILKVDPRGLLFHSRDSISQVVEPTQENFRKGWRRMAQFGLFFFPSKIEVEPFFSAIGQAANVDPRMRGLGTNAVPGNLYPWRWKENDADIENFESFADGKLFCPPILTKLILDREPER